MLNRLKEFHGHLGPYVVIGYKMGLLATRILNSRDKNLKAEVKTGGKPPISCIIDGIQLSSGCTSGKGNISVSNEKIPEAKFSNGEKSVIIKLKDNIRRKIDSGIRKESEKALWIYNLDNNNLFDIEIKKGD
jgi:formylmethanofuran dehydrogenase subunit E